MVRLAQHEGGEDTNNSTSPAVLIRPSQPAQAFLYNENSVNVTVLGRHHMVIDCPTIFVVWF